MLLSTLGFLLGWHLLHGGWENLKEDWTGKYRDRPIPSSAPLALGPDGYYWGVTGDSDKMPGYVYKMKVDGLDWKRVYTFLHDASQPIGISPMGGLVSDGVDSLLGVTYGREKEPDFGTLYKIKAATGVLTTLVRCSGKDGPHLGAIPVLRWPLLGAGSSGGAPSSEERMTPGRSSCFTRRQTCSPPSRNSPPHLILPWHACPKRRVGQQWQRLLVGDNFLWWAEQRGTVFKVDSITGN